MTIDHKGKEEIVYTKEKAMSPILKLKEIDHEGMYLKKGLNYDLLMG